MLRWLLGSVAALLPGRPAGKPAVRRSSRWPATRKVHLLLEPSCQACGARERLEVHHVIPVHVAQVLGRPELELDPRNLITLCEGAVVNCHLLFGHLRLWQSWNHQVREDVETWLRKIRSRPTA